MLRLAHGAQPAEGLLGAGSRDTGQCARLRGGRPGLDTGTVDLLSQQPTRVGRAVNAAASQSKRSRWAHQVISRPEPAMKPAQLHTHPDAASPAVLGSVYGSCHGRGAFSRERSPGCWQVKVHEPDHRKAVLDGWRIAAAGSPTLSAASAATGFC